MVAKRKGWTQAQARLVVDEFEAGDLSMAEFARQRGVNAERIRRWRIRFSAEAQERGPRIVELIAQGAVSTTRIQVRCPSGHTVEFGEVELSTGLRAALAAVYEVAGC